MLTELPAEVITFNRSFQIQYSPSHTGNVLGSCTVDFAYCMSLIGTFLNLVPENYNIFFFLNARVGGIQQILQSEWFWERAEISNPGCSQQTESKP